MRAGGGRHHRGARGLWSASVVGGRVVRGARGVAGAEGGAQPDHLLVGARQAGRGGACGLLKILGHGERVAQVRGRGGAVVGRLEGRAVGPDDEGRGGPALRHGGARSAVDLAHMFGGGDQLAGAVEADRRGAGVFRGRRGDGGGDPGAQERVSGHRG